MEKYNIIPILYFFILFIIVFKFWYYFLIFECDFSINNKQDLIMVLIMNFFITYLLWTYTIIVLCGFFHVTLDINILDNFNYSQFFTTYYIDSNYYNSDFPNKNRQELPTIYEEYEELFVELRTSNNSVEDPDIISYYENTGHNDSVPEIGITFQENGLKNQDNLIQNSQDILINNNYSTLLEDNINKSRFSLDTDEITGNITVNRCIVKRAISGILSLFKNIF